MGIHPAASQAVWSANDTGDHDEPGGVCDRGGRRRRNEVHYFFELLPHEFRARPAAYPVGAS